LKVISTPLGNIISVRRIDPLTGTRKMSYMEVVPTERVVQLVGLFLGGDSLREGLSVVLVLIS